MSTRNINKVEKEAWKKWTEEGRELFNHLYEIMRDNQNLFTHPKAKPIPEEQWDTTAHNAAWEAAMFVSGIDEM